MKNLQKLADTLNKKYNLIKNAETSDIQELVHVLGKYERLSDFLTVFLSALDANLEIIIKESDPETDAETINGAQKQVQLIENAISSVINNISEIDDQYYERAGVIK